MWNYLLDGSLYQLMQQTSNFQKITTFIILIFKSSRNHPMKHLYGNLLYNQMYYQHTKTLFQAMSQNHSNQFLLSVLSDHKKLIQKLLQNQNILAVRFESLLMSQTTDTDNNFQEADQNLVQNNFLNEKQQIEIERPQLLLSGIKDVQISKFPIKRQIQIVSNNLSSQLQTQILEQNQIQNKQYEYEIHSMKKSCETKNIIKNFGKSILTFMRKNKTITRNVLEKFQVNESEFYQLTQLYEGRLNSRSDLKLFWTDQTSNIGKVFRSISNIYLKKHSLKHTFSSRVKNIGIHIKYRQRLLNILKNPEDFSSMKLN